MPEARFPGVYVQEVRSGVRHISAAPTSVTGFVGRARRGPVATAASAPAPTHLRSWAEYERTFGGLWDESPMSFAVHQFFLQGGTDALVVRVVAGASTATATFTDGTFGVVASSPGAWGGAVEFAIDHSDGRGGSLLAPLFNLSVRHLDSAQHEGFARVSSDPTHHRFVSTVLEAESALLRSAILPSGTSIPSVPSVPARPAERGFTLLQLGPAADGVPVSAAEVTHPSLAALGHGMYALDRADGFNVLVIPPYAFGVDVAPADYAQAATYCASRRAMLIADAPHPVSATPAVGSTASPKAPPSFDAMRSLQQAVRHAQAIGAHENAACFFPHLLVANPLHGGRLDTQAPSGAVAGIIARTDAARGVWKAAAGTEAKVHGATGVSVAISHRDNAELNAIGVNALREFTRFGVVLWGARTLAGGASPASEWRYLPVRRLGLFIEESVRRGTEWTAFEPNGEPLWSELRVAVEVFLHGLFRQGAFPGQSMREAYFVKCGRDTTTPADIAAGRVQLLIGVAPLKPAEFVVLRLALDAARP